MSRDAERWTRTRRGTVQPPAQCRAFASAWPGASGAGANAASVLARANYPLGGERAQRTSAGPIAALSAAHQSRPAYEARPREPPARLRDGRERRPLDVGRRVGACGSWRVSALLLAHAPSRPLEFGLGRETLRSRTDEQSVPVERPECSGVREWSRRDAKRVVCRISRNARSRVRRRRGAGGLGTSPPSQRRGALRPGSPRAQRPGGGTDARSGMEDGRAAPSAGGLPRRWAERVSVGASDQRERANEDGRGC